MAGAAQPPAALLVSAAHKSSGKTTISIGLCAALRARGLAVQPFKKGPDYIDPMWLTAAAGRACRNLDSVPVGQRRDPRHASRATRRTPTSRSSRATRGSTTASRSTAATATRRWRRLLGLPVVLVIDARGMTRGIAPLILGYQAFDRDVRIAGVILNNLGGSRHEAEAARRDRALHRRARCWAPSHCDPRLAIVERHLGLMPSNEADGAAERVAAIGSDRRPAGRSRRRARRSPRDAPPLAAGRRRARPTRCAARPSPTCGSASRRTARSASTTPTTSTRCARPAPTLVALRHAGGCRSCPTSTALFIGGGFPEMLRAPSWRRTPRCARGSAPRSRPACRSTPSAAGSCTSPARSAATGADVRDGRRDSRRRRDARAPGRARLREPRGDRGLSLAGARPAGDAIVRAHEFHYSSLENLPADLRCAYAVKRGHGVDGRRDGIVVQQRARVLCPPAQRRRQRWAARFVDFVRHAGYRRSRAQDIVRRTSRPRAAGRRWRI